MTDQLLGLLKVLLLVALYAFFARVLWAVWHEVRLPAVTRAASAPGQPAANRPGDIASVPKPYRVRAVRVIAPAPMKGIEFEIGDRLVTLGRGPDNSLSAPDDEFASVHHASIERRDGVVHVSDRSSTNGTFVNGERIHQPTTLRIGDRIQFGAVIVEAIK